MINQLYTLQLHAIDRFCNRLPVGGSKVEAEIKGVAVKVEGKAESEKASKKDKASEDGKDTPWFLPGEEEKEAAMETNVCKTVDNKDGTYTITFIVDQTGSFNLEVLLDGEKVKGTAAVTEKLLAENQEQEKKAAMARAKRDGEAMTVKEVKKVKTDTSEEKGESAAAPAPAAEPLTGAAAEAARLSNS